MVALGLVTNIFQRGAASMGGMNYVLDAKPSIDGAAPRWHGGAANRIPRWLTFTFPRARVPEFEVATSNGSLNGSSSNGKVPVRRC